MNDKNDKTVKLNAQQERFSCEYVKDLKGGPAAIRAGYAKKGAAQTAARLLTYVNIIARIDELKTERLDTVKIDAKYVLNRLIEIDELDVADIVEADGSMKQILAWPKAWRTSISGLDIQEMLVGDIQSVIKKIKWPDKLRNLELLGKHISIKAWEETIQNNDTPIGNIKIEVVGGVVNANNND